MTSKTNPNPNKPRQALTLTQTRTNPTPAPPPNQDLSDLGCPAASVHGDKDQRERERALNAFKAGQITVIIGTDVLGRGIDVPAVTHVINYDAPGDIEDYTHRIGRTGRAGHQVAITPQPLTPHPILSPTLTPTLTPTPTPTLQ